VTPLLRAIGLPFPRQRRGLDESSVQEVPGRSICSALRIGMWTDSSPPESALNGISIGSAVFAQLTLVPVTDKQTQRPRCARQMCSNNPHLGSSTARSAMTMRPDKQQIRRSQPNYLIVMRKIITNSNVTRNWDEDNRCTRTGMTVLSVCFGWVLISCKMERGAARKQYPTGQNWWMQLADIARRWIG